jgi:hypothetical protein
MKKRCRTYGFPKQTPQQLLGPKSFEVLQIIWDMGRIKNQILEAVELDPFILKGLESGVYTKDTDAHEIVVDLMKAAAL